MNQPNRSKVISIRLSAVEYSQLAADAETQKQAVSGVLLSAWRKQNTLDAQQDQLAEIANRLKKIEAAMPDLDAIAKWAGAVNESMTQMQEANTKRFGRVEQILIAIAEAAGLRVRPKDA